MSDVGAGANWPVGLLASAYGAGDDPRELMMAICVGYFEHAPSTPGLFTVSGYVAPKARWRYFDERWPRALRAERLSAFSGPDFVRGNGEFAAGWDGNRSRRDRLITALSDLIDQHVMRGFSCSVRMEDYDGLNHEYALAEAISGPYGLCAGRVISQVQRWMADRHPEDLTLFVFEDGDVDHRQIRRALVAEGVDRGEPVQVWPRQWTDQRGRRRYLRPFEACDLLIRDCQSPIVQHLSRRYAWESQTIDRDRLVRLCQALCIRRTQSVGRQAASG